MAHFVHMHIHHFFLQCLMDLESMETQIFPMTLCPTGYYNTVVNIAPNFRDLGTLSAIQLFMRFEQWDCSKIQFNYPKEFLTLDDDLLH